jgi:hypothetical protein
MVSGMSSMFLYPRTRIKDRGSAQMKCTKCGRPVTSGNSVIVTANGRIKVALDQYR